MKKIIFISANNPLRNAGKLKVAAYSESVQSGKPGK